ncbi:porin [Pseudoalteromonas xiamenensis]|uniref:porin n=1 Tax=Pseudoalteromonas xiamenensis TaxID=882626 RepID=UPI0027E53026|nr:porin [Pseudoalteromonas xiamenensis]WMN59068.1 porin [Pseudoalteromonas xiamenensis]
MKNHLIFVAISTLLCSSSALADDLVKLYGRANIGIQSKDDGTSSVVSAESYASRIGVKGNTKVSDSLEAFYVFEFEVKPTENENDGKTADNLSARSEYIGVKGAFGQFIVGRNDTPMKRSQNSADLMNDYTGDISSLMVGENRLGDTIQYTTPSLAHLQFEVSYIAKDNNKQNGDAGMSLAASYGDRKFKSMPFFVSVARDSKVAGQDVNRVTVQGKMGALTLSGMYQQSEKVDTDDKRDSYVVSASYKIDDYNLLAQYQDSESEAGKMKDSGTGTSIGVERMMSKQVRMFLWYSQFELDNKPDQDHIAVGLRYDF